LLLLEIDNYGIYTSDLSNFGIPCVLLFEHCKFEDSFGFKYLLSSFNILPHLLGKHGLAFPLLFLLYIMKDFLPIGRRILAFQLIVKFVGKEKY